MPDPAVAVVACTSLHHVADVGEVLDAARAALAAGGTLVVVEWARERLNEATARWCFNRLPPPSENLGWAAATLQRMVGLQARLGLGTAERGPGRGAVHAAGWRTSCGKLQHPV